jgi:hypothetical protein
MGRFPTMIVECGFDRISIDITFCGEYKIL